MPPVTHTARHRTNSTMPYGHPMKWLKRIAITLVLLLGLALALPFFVSLDDYIPQIEKSLSARFKEPVSIRGIRFAALPLPHLTVRDIAIGTDVKIGLVSVTPDLYSLWQPVRVVKRIEIDGLTLTQQARALIPVWLASDSQPALVRVESILFHDAQIDFGKSRLGPFDAHITLDSKSEPTEAAISTKDGKLKAFIKAEQSKYLIEASAHAWTLPVGPALLLDDLNIKGVATLDDLKLSQVNVSLYGGTVKGHAGVNWQHGLQLDGELAIRDLEVQQVAYIVLSKSHVSGKLTAQPVFSASLNPQTTGKFSEKFMAGLRLKMPFNLKNGVLKGVDIEQAATRLSKKGTTGGETRFETLSGHLNLAHRTFRFTQLQIASGALAVDGNLDISPVKKLSGRIDAEVSIMGAGVSVPLNVTGTVDSPTLFPTGAAMTGAAIGTVLLGPGTGTAAGVKIGDWIDKLLSKKK